MTITLGLVANVYQEANALPGWLETHLPFFDDVRVLHAGPGGAHSDDGTLEILHKWKIPVAFTSMDEGFGYVRTLAIHSSPCDYVMLLDADERFFPINRTLYCEGEATPHSNVDAILSQYHFRGGHSPDWVMLSQLGAEIKVQQGPVYDAGRELRHLLETRRPDAVATVRRHWHDFSMQRPTQRWDHEPDWQMRVVRNSPGIHYDPSVRMHERLLGVKDVVYGDLGNGPYFEHFHLFFKRQEQEQRAHDIAIYDALHAGKAPPSYKQFKGADTHEKGGGLL